MACALSTTLDRPFLFKSGDLNSYIFKHIRNIFAGTPEWFSLSDIKKNGCDFQVIHMNIECMLTNERLLVDSVGFIRVVNESNF